LVPECNILFVRSSYSENVIPIWEKSRFTHSGFLWVDKTIFFSKSFHHLFSFFIFFFLVQYTYVVNCKLILDKTNLDWVWHIASIRPRLYQNNSPLSWATKTITFSRVCIKIQLIFNLIWNEIWEPVSFSLKYCSLLPWNDQRYSKFEELGWTKTLHFLAGRKEKT